MSQEQHSGDKPLESDRDKDGGEQCPMKCEDFPPFEPYLTHYQKAVLNPTKLDQVRAAKASTPSYISPPHPDTTGTFSSGTQADNVILNTEYLINGEYVTVPMYVPVTMTAKMIKEIERSAEQDISVAEEEKSVGTRLLSCCPFCYRLMPQYSVILKCSHKICIPCYKKLVKLVYLTQEDIWGGKVRCPICGEFNDCAGVAKTWLMGARVVDGHLNPCLIFNCQFCDPDQVTEDLKLWPVCQEHGKPCKVFSELDPGCEDCYVRGKCSRETLLEEVSFYEDIYASVRDVLQMIKGYFAGLTHLWLERYKAGCHKYGSDMASAYEVSVYMTMVESYATLLELWNTISVGVCFKDDGGYTVQAVYCTFQWYHDILNFWGIDLKKGYQRDSSESEDDEDEDPHFRFKRSPTSDACHADIDLSTIRERVQFVRQKLRLSYHERDVEANVDTIESEFVAMLRKNSDCPPLPAIPTVCYMPMSYFLLELVPPLDPSELEPASHAAWINAQANPCKRLIPPKASFKDIPRVHFMRDMLLNCPGQRLLETLKDLKSLLLKGEINDIMYRQSIRQVKRDIAVMEARSFAVRWERDYEPFNGLSKVTAFQEALLKGEPYVTGDKHFEDRFYCPNLKFKEARWYPANMVTDLLWAKEDVTNWLKVAMSARCHEHCEAVKGMLQSVSQAMKDTIVSFTTVPIFKSTLAEVRLFHYSYDNYQTFESMMMSLMYDEELSTLLLFDCKIMSPDAIRSFMLNAKRLRRLSFTNCDFIQDSYEAFAYGLALRGNDHPVDITFDRGSLTIQGLRVFAQVFHECPQSTHSLRSLDAVTMSDGEAVAKILDKYFAALSITITIPATK
jgi:hypothetical protein